MMNATNVEWTLPNLPRDRFVSLLKRNNVRAGCELVLRFVLQLFAAYLVIVSNSKIGVVGSLMAAAIYGHFISFWGWAGIGHEFYHASVFANRRLNRILFETTSVMTWNNYGFFQLTHSQHHRYTLHNSDLEARSDGRIPVHRVLPLVTVDVFQMVRRVTIVLRNSFGSFPHRAEAVLAGSPEIRKHAIVAARKIVAFQSVFLGLLLISGVNWFVVFLLFSGPFSFQLINQALQVVQHKSLSVGAIDFRENSRTILLGPVSTFLYSSMNFHLEHHMYPGVPYYNLRNLRGLILEAGFELPRPPRGLWRVVMLSLRR